jgi:fibronectin-binding autotransporter adhesin
LTLASGETLTGNGTLRGNVVANSGAIFQPGSAIGTLVVTLGSLTLNAGSTTVIQINKSLSPSNSMAQVVGNVAYGGTLVITNLGTNGFVAGDSFKLFSGAVCMGAFSKIIPAIPGINLAWNTNNMAVGILDVVASPTPSPKVVTATMNGNSFIFSGSNGVPGWPYWVLTSTNLSLPVTNWTLTSTGAFDANGNFILTNPVSAGAPQNFYLLELP